MDIEINKLTAADLHKISSNPNEEDIDNAIYDILDCALNEARDRKFEVEYFMYDFEFDKKARESLKAKLTERGFKVAIKKEQGGSTKIVKLSWKDLQPVSPVANSVHDASMLSTNV